jgi:transcription elongation GreA/GreB family factor
LAYGAGIPHSYVKLAIVGVREFELSDTFLREIIFQLETLAPDDSAAVQIGHIVCLQIGDEEPERFLLLDGLGGVTLDDVSTLSVDTPIGHAVVGKEVGDQASASVPGGQLSIRILSLE